MLRFGWYDHNSYMAEQLDCVVQLSGQPAMLRKSIMLPAWALYMYKLVKTVNSNRRLQQCVTLCMQIRSRDFQNIVPNFPIFVCFDITFWFFVHYDTFSNLGDLSQISGFHQSSCYNSYYSAVRIGTQTQTPNILAQV